MSATNITYLFDNWQYTTNELVQKTGLSAGQLRVLPPGVLKLKMDGKHQLTYVGLIAVNRCIIVCLPKYLAKRKETVWEVAGQTHREEAKLIMQVLRLYDKNTKSLLAESDDEEEKTDFSGEPLTAIDLIDHFREYGYWYKSELVLIADGTSEINWQKTIERTIPLISDESVVYPNEYSYRRSSYNDSLILQIQLWAVRYCIEKYNDLLPGFDGVQYDAEAVEEYEDLGYKEYLIGVLERELLASYRDSDITLLRLLIQLLDDQAEGEEESIQLFGTTSFHVVWEKACKVAFGDRSSEAGKLPTPEWIHGANTFYEDELLEAKKNRLTPDAVWYSTGHLLVVDAKYYNVRFEAGKVKSNPGMPDVMKQLVYEDVLVEILKLHDAIKVNAFVLPRSDVHGNVSEKEDWLWGWIDSKIPIFEGKYIAILLIPPANLFECYLSQTQIVDQKKFIDYLSSKSPSNKKIE